MGKRTDLKFFFVFTVIILLTVFLTVKCYAQTIEGYTADFLLDAENLGVTFSRSAPKIVEQDGYLFMRKSGHLIAVDAYTSSRYNTIFFDMSSNMYCYNLKVLVYHEFGHWYLYRKETTNNSIMNTMIWHDRSWEDLSFEDRTYYIKELFNKQ